MRDKFQDYIEQGQRAIETHPDYPHGVDSDTAAVDTIVSVLHTVYGRKPLSEVMEDAFGLLERASRSFEGDYEDIGRNA